MSRKRTLEEKEHSKLVTKLAGLKWRETVLKEGLRINQIYQDVVEDEIQELLKQYQDKGVIRLTEGEKRLAVTNKIMAIKNLRERYQVVRPDGVVETPVGLSEAKNLVDAYLASVQRP